jgi:hypothetical protein
MTYRHSLILAGLLAVTRLAWATTPEEAIVPIQTHWAEIKYTQPEKQQADSYAKLAEQARKIAEANPGAAEPLVWEGIVLSSRPAPKAAWAP